MYVCTQQRVSLSLSRVQNVTMLAHMQILAFWQPSARNMYMCTYIYVRIYILIHIHVHIHICLYIHICICIIDTYLPTCLPTYIHENIQHKDVSLSVILCRSRSLSLCSVLQYAAGCCHELQCVAALYVWVHLFLNMHTHTHTHTCMPVWVCMFACLYACMHVCMYEHMYGYINVCMYIQYVCVSVRTIHWSAVAGVCMCVWVTFPTPC